MMVETYTAGLLAAVLWVAGLYGLWQDAARWCAHRRHQRLLDDLWDGDA